MICELCSGLFARARWAAGRYAVVAGSGDLHIRAVRQEDSGRKFVCLVANVLNGERRQSDPVFLTVKGIQDTHNTQ